jgi:hypothetical protein
VEEALEQAADLMKQSRWSEAKILLEQAQRKGALGDKDLENRLRKALHDANLVESLEAVFREGSARND